VLSYLQAVIIGVLQGVTELFPVSSLGHSVLVPALIGGDWKHLVTESASSSSDTSPYLAFIVALHVATALALLVFFRREWVRIIRALLISVPASLRARRIVADDPDSRLAWLLIIGTIPVGITGLALEHSFRTLFAKPSAAAAFLMVNGVILLIGEQLRRRAASAAARPEAVAAAVPAGVPGPAYAEAGSADQVSAEATAARSGDVVGGDLPAGSRRALAKLDYREAGLIGLFQTLALFAGISRSGITMVGGLARGLNHEDAARFSFLLATPIILAAGVLKVPSLFGHAGDHIHGQVLVGFLVAGLAAYAAIRFLDRFFRTRTLTPFAIYSLIAGVFCLIRFA
jgi:undecaprenyl-diphosphatase